jgi:hypothetical protein
MLFDRNAAPFLMDYYQNCSENSADFAVRAAQWLEYTAPEYPIVTS